MIRIAAFTGGRTDPSSRYRVRQHIARFHGEGIELIDFYARSGRYAPRPRAVRPWWAASLLTERLGQVLASTKVDATLLQREMMATVCTWEPFTRAPRILDVDDAIYLRRGGRAARKLAQLADLVVCGNESLADWFGQWNRNIAIIPTSVDTLTMRPRTDLSSGRPTVIIGWVGVSPNHRYLPIAEQAIAEVMKRFPEVRLRIISDRDPPLPKINPGMRDFIKWSPSIEAEAVANLDIGIMPLADSSWERGKCSYKMLQYMACGLPVVVSPVGMNNLILSSADVGYAAKTTDEWVAALTELVANEGVRRRFGAAGRAVVERQFSAAVIGRQLVDTFRTVVGVAA
jgi:glycosyltransferase involved in cell wall biosynthesis